MWCDSQVFLLARNLVTPCLGREPKARVVTLDLSFGHNLCFKCSNGSCKLISDIYISRIFHWYKERLNQLSFDPCNRSLKIRESIWDSNSQNESSLGNVKVHSLTLFCTPGSMRCDSRAFLLARTFASLCLGRKPKVRVVIHTFSCLSPCVPSALESSSCVDSFSS
jgi:hypothetical protein